MFKLISRSIQRVRFQEFFIFFTIFYISTMLIIQYKQSYFSEENIKLSQITKQEKRLASEVEVGMFINNFQKFSFYKNEFEMDATIWFKFPIGNESINTIKNFSFVNGEIASKSKPIVKIVDNSAIVGFQVLVKFITPLSYRYFPASDHKLTIILQNKAVSPAEMYFSGSIYNFEISEKAHTGSWIPKTQYFESGYAQTTLKEEKGAIKADFPSAVFTIDFYNEDLRHYIILYLPLFLLFFLIFSSLFTTVTDINTRLAVVAGVTPILALHSLVIDAVSPSGSNITKVDQLYLTLIVLALAILLFQSYIGLIIKGCDGVAKEILEEKTTKLKKLNDIAIILVLSALIISVTYMTFT